MNQVSANDFKPTIQVIGDDSEFFLKVGDSACYHGALEDRAYNNMERWGMCEMNNGGENGRRIMTYRFDFAVNEESDLRTVAEMFIERLGITDYSLNVTFS